MFGVTAGVGVPAQRLLNVVCSRTCEEPGAWGLRCCFQFHISAPANPPTPELITEEQLEPLLHELLRTLDHRPEEHLSSRQRRSAPVSQTVSQMFDGCLMVEASQPACCLEVHPSFSPL